MMKKGLVIILFFLIIYGFMSVLLLNKSRLDVLSIFVDKIRIRNSETVSQNGISLGSGDDDIFIDFVPEKGVVIFGDNRLQLADNVICLLNGDLLNSYPLENDDTICVTDSGKKICWTFKDNRLWQKEKSFEEFEEKGWRQAIYPLANIREFKDKIHSFIYFDGGSPRILLIDNKDKLTVTNKENKKYYKKKQFDIPLKEKNFLQFRKVFQRYVSYVDQETGELVTEKKTARISSIKKGFDISSSSKGFHINFKKPVKQNIILADILNLKSDSIVLTFGSLSHYGSNVIIPKFVGKISDLSLRLDVKSKFDENMIQVTDPHSIDPKKGTYLIPYGKLTIAEDDTDTEIDIWILKLGIPWNLIIYYLGICLLFAVLYYPSFRDLIKINSNAFTHLLLLVAVGLIFLSFRLLFAYKAFIQYPFRSDLYRDAIFAFVFVPFLILEIFERSSTFGKTFLRALVLLIPCGVYLLQLSQFSSELLGAELLNEKLVGLAVVMLFMHFIRLFIEKFFEIFGRISLSPLSFWLPLIIIILLRKFFVKEAIFGIRASFVSDLIILGLLFGFIRNYFKNNEFTRRNSVKIILFTFLFFLFNAIFSGDRGYLIFFISIPLIFIYMGLLSQKSKTNDIRKICISNGAVLVILLIMGIFFIGNIMLSITDMDRAALLTSYETRLLGFTDFSLLKEQGYRVTEIFAQFYETMRFYAGSGFWGRGYLQSPLGRESNWFNDNVPSAFLMSEFGLRGVIIIFIAYGLILGIVIPGFGAIHWNSGAKCQLLQWRFLGLAAACLLIIPGIYMLLANVGLVPFTGKNVFLFGLDSYSDLMESALLFGLIARGIQDSR